MNNKGAIKTATDLLIKTNGTGDITGALDQILRDDTTDKLYEDIYGLGYWAKGIATVGTNPGSPDEKAMYMNTYATVNRTYTHFGGIIVGAYQIGFFTWDLISWHFTTYLDLSSSVTSNPYKHILFAASGATFSHQLDTGVPCDKFVSMISFNKVSGTPVVKCGETLGGEEFLPSTTITGRQLCKPEKCLDDSTGYIYFTISGGVVDVRIDYIESF